VFEKGGREERGGQEESTGQEKLFRRRKKWPKNEVKKRHKGWYVKGKIQGKGGGGEKVVRGQTQEATCPEN